MHLNKSLEIGRAELDVFSSLSVNDVNEVSFFSPFPLGLSGDRHGGYFPLVELAASFGKGSLGFGA